MTIRRNEAWGSSGALAAGAPVVDDDAQLHEIVVRARLEGRPIGEVGLLGGDLCRAVGGAGLAARLDSPAAVRLPVDIVRVDFEVGTTWFVAHLVAGWGRLFGVGSVAMNGDWLGDSKLGPRAHPNDGLVDVTIGRVPFRQRRTAERRARSGTHLPHPALEVRRAPSVEVDLGRPTRVIADGVAVGRGRLLRLTVEPDSLVVVV